jgi:GTP-binding protein
MNFLKRLKPKFPTQTYRSFCSNNRNPSTTYTSSLWEKGLANKDHYVHEHDMIGHNEKFFKDFVHITFKGGHGGQGSVSHESTRARAKGRATGGSGGKGGDVFIKATIDNPDFSYVRSKHVTGNPGKDGKSTGNHGKNGKDLHYAVPVGTAAFELKSVEKQDEETGEWIREKREYFIGEINEYGEELRIVKGGQGSQGNKENSRKKVREPGQAGEQKLIKLEVRMIADIGFIGYPNAGKSTLLASITRSTPKIAAYAFTTINPNLGQIKFIDDRNITVADIPGLIEKSSENKGLGHQFLSHCVKSKVLAFVIDMSLEQTVAPWDQYNNLKNELNAYSEKFDEKEEILIGTKADLKGTEEARNQFKRVTGKDVIMVSAKENQNLSMLIREFRHLIYKDAEVGPEEMNYGS